ncbi:hypothetical protein F6X40_09345 [Paraburkholderia sp. UCT31]|uniref:SIR2 family NAD-dependent protein deacylase n=1 Tax=Paraburkholderia sp. UCT31 TaxID=2615209 RepID=UPI001654FD0C|nr:Sir2 family NAD-dependent protein deacetylase [Paraburkholderia sp. UCT31]MBC8737012.1 hypothetical protein [Paraburkholderia sp. UCT31]
MFKEELLAKAVEHLRAADGLVITAGAGMGVDSGLPDFRGTEGFWRAYPALKGSGITFEDIASPAAFAERPTQAWGFYGHRLKLYRNTTPHEGFQILRRWAARFDKGAFVFTSNVDGHFQKAGFEESRVVECHGSINYLQCSRSCQTVWAAEPFTPEVDEVACELLSEMPRCPRCGSMSRPNILMFGDYKWYAGRTEEQMDRLDTWLQTVKRPVVVELGAGKAIPTVRGFGSRLKAPLIRINARESAVGRPEDVGLEGPALDSLRVLDLKFSA